MKKLSCILLFSMLFIACKTTSTITNTKLDNKTEKLVKGNWIISSVDYAGSDYLKVNSFNLADSKCFVGSNWNFISNNNKGQMKLNNPSSSCKDFSSPITWFINKDQKFVLKFINNYKAKEKLQGFILDIKNVTDSSFQLIDQLNVAGQNTNITYTFQKQ